jgi:hypothetical protein
MAGITRRRAAAIVAPLATAALSIGSASSAQAQPAEFRRRIEEPISVKLYTGEQLTCAVSAFLDRELDPDATARAGLFVTGDEGCGGDQVYLTVSVRYETPNGEVLTSRAFSSSGSGLQAAAEPVGTVISGHYDIRYGLCDESTSCVFEYDIAAPK